MILSINVYLKLSISIRFHAQLVNISVYHKTEVSRQARLPSTGLLQTETATFDKTLPYESAMNFPTLMQMGHTSSYQHTALKIPGNNHFHRS